MPRTMSIGIKSLSHRIEFVVIVLVAYHLRRIHAMADLRQVDKLIGVDYSQNGDHKGATTDQRSASIIVDIGI